MGKKKFDVFICHASEDKESIARPLATELRKRGLSVWFDEFELKVGDSLRESIEKGLTTSRFGVVLFSFNFFKKKWPKKELNGLFARELAGTKKRILPIVHEIGIAELQKQVPIQSDRVFLQSSAGVQELATSLLRVVRPTLEAPDTLRERVFEISDTFLDAAKAKYPGYDFNISADSSSPTGKRIEIRISDPSKVAATNQINISFVGEGARKADEFIRTGKPQTWKTGEFATIRSELPFFKTVSQGELSVGSSKDLKAKPISLTCGEALFPYLLMKLVRSGTDEIEVEISAEGEPIQINMVFPISQRSRTIDTSLSWRVNGIRPKKILTLIAFLDGVQNRKDMVIRHLQDDVPTLTVPIGRGKQLNSPFDQGSRNIVRTTSQIEETFNVRLDFSFSISEEDRESLIILDSLMNGTLISVNISNTLTIVKGQDSQADAVVMGSIPADVNFFAPVENFTGFFPLLGAKIPAPMWGVGAVCSINLTEKARDEYARAPAGTTVVIPLTNNGVGRYRWASDFPSPNSNRATRKRPKLLP